MSESNWFMDLLPYLGAILAALPGILAWRAHRNKTEGEAAGVISSAAVTLTEGYRKRMQELETEVGELRHRVEALEEKLDAKELQERALIERIKADKELFQQAVAGFEQLYEQIRLLGKEPVWHHSEIGLEANE